MLTRYGFTSVVDTGSVLENTLALRRRVASGEVAGPHILTSGMILFPQNGLPYYITEFMPPDVVKKFAEGEAATPEDAVRIVDQQIADGADFVKLYVVTWLRRHGKIVPSAMPLPVVKAAVQEAHRKGKLVFAHPSTMKGVELVLAGDVDVMVHTVEEVNGWNRAIAARLVGCACHLDPDVDPLQQESRFRPDFEAGEELSGSPRSDHVWHGCRLSDRLRCTDQGVRPPGACGADVPGDPRLADNHPRGPPRICGS